MLQHAFEKLGALRVEFKTDALNEKSRAALLKIGAVEEGVFRRHMIMPGGRRRDSAYYSVIEEEWPRVHQLLETRLARLAKAQQQGAEPVGS
jgi:RimJ/RimL family protein N-acetyltransferase